jgi:four helix bundle protein
METIYWLELLHETDFITTGEFEGMITDCEELRKMLSASTKTLRKTIGI